MAAPLKRDEPKRDAEMDALAAWAVRVRAERVDALLMRAEKRFPGIVAAIGPKYGREITAWIRDVDAELDARLRLLCLQLTGSGA